MFVSSHTEREGSTRHSTGLQCRASNTETVSTAAAAADLEAVPLSSQQCLVLFSKHGRWGLQAVGHDLHQPRRPFLVEHPLICCHTLQPIMVLQPASQQVAHDTEGTKHRRGTRMH